MGVGGDVRCYDKDVDGRIWSVPLVWRLGEVDYLECYGVSSIVDCIGREAVPGGPNTFPDTPKEVWWDFS